MITFTIKILLAFNIKPPKEKQKGHKSTKPHPEGKQKGKKPPPPPQETEQDPPYVLRLDQNFTTAHVEYELLPGKIKPYWIDVICWRNAAKIFTADGSKVFRTVSGNNLTFVPISIVHYLRELTIDELLTLQHHVIEFNIFSDKNKLGNAAKNNKTEIIYIREIDVDIKGFVEGYTDRAKSTSLTKRSVLGKSEGTEEDIVSKSSKFDGLSRLKYDTDYADTFYEIIDYLSGTRPKEQLNFRDFIQACTPLANDTKTPTKPPEEKKSKKSTTQKPKPEKSTGKLTLRMQGEIFFTDSDTVFTIENQRSEVNHLFVIPQVENLISRFQKIELNPIIIKLKSIQRFPVKVFENTDYTDLFLKYSIPCIAECTTSEKPMAETIRFMESHLFPTHKLSKIKLLEYLESKRFVVEVFGVQRYQLINSDPKMFGEKAEDRNISRIDDPKVPKYSMDDPSKTQVVPLAYCSYDLSSLLKNVWDFRANEQLHTPEHRITSEKLQQVDPPEASKQQAEDEAKCDFLQRYRVSINRINLGGIEFSPSKKSPLKEWMLIEHDTVLDLEAYLLSPQSAALVLHQVPNTYKRLLVIFFAKEKAQTCLRNILTHNGRVMNGELKDNDILTGFIIDNGNNFVIYVEGHSVGYILNVWQDIDGISPQEAKVFFNTDQAYEQRLYHVCNKFSGFNVINMKIPLQNIFTNQKTYVRGNVPLLCSRALTKLNLILLTGTMKLMFQHDLFPTMEELISLDIEYGVPWAWKNCAPSLMSLDPEEVGDSGEEINR
ncbi:uncharacterized protein LOC126738377 [Anthonomus grandis grandis]|uniref:uncharacterized protein LOC126738377 n=1 Tax=Anthonomus grandis grandis TaxID=2921223 RepID=UPI00216652BD|nr:uncharacterized protein LOC126738377 [Anthonomus grandis grandis]